MNILIIILLAVAAYLIGSFSSALWYGKWFYGIDIREHGSKNAGSTNVLRVLGWKCAIPVFITDVIKSFVPTMFFVMLLNRFATTDCGIFVEQGSEAYYLYQLLFGMMAIWLQRRKGRCFDARTCACTRPVVGCDSIGCIHYRCADNKDSFRFVDVGGGGFPDCGLCAGLFP